MLLSGSKELEIVVSKERAAKGNTMSGSGDIAQRHSTPASTGPRFSPQDQERDVGVFPSHQLTNIPGLLWAGPV